MPVTDNPSISIIMPVFNSEKYLEETLNSALNQSLKNIELICIDDGSPDSSLQILRNFSEKDERIHIITQENSGSGVARNAGLNLARGNYIAFLDSDDLYPDEACLENLYQLALSHNANIAGGSLLFLDNGEISKAVTKDTDFTFPDTRVIKYKDFQQAYYYQRFIYSREMLRKYSIKFPEYRRFQDVVFFVKAMVAAGEFLSTDLPTYVYRKSNNYATLSDIQINDMLKGYIDVLTIAGENDFRKLFAFLSKKLSGNNNISKMINNSIESGNKTADDLYTKVLNICSSYDKKVEIKVDKKPTKKKPFKGLRRHIKSLFSKSGK